MNADESTFGKFKCGGIDITLDDAAELAKQAGAAIMEIYNSDDFAEKIKDPKADGSPLTEADLAANKIICEGLKKLYPTIPIISEENKAVPYEERKDWECFWCIDPLDGTKEFINRNGEFTVNIGLCEKNKPVAGIVYCPALDPPVIYKGVTASPPAIRENCDDLGGGLGYDSFKAVFPKTFDEADAGLTLVASKSHSNEATEKFMSKYKNPKKISKGSSLKFLMVAEGTAHIYPRMGPTHEWDTCAAQAIVECGGGKVVQDTPAGFKGPALEYNKESGTINPNFVVYGKVTPKKAKGKKKKMTLGGGKGQEAAAGGMSPAVLIAILVALLAAFYASTMM
mmetsp:Transcript_7563/g.19324  ORF Transcript_7563/g.19324 Transcript_7563/m.19324 type:complete len:340 (-) Transcript_7563:46-1065(-)|eukprot:CAMPEP_0119487060 /NCGR_PEP_ID=MMETSP1344-20130328/13247_1 /TAXON_ID=236787 /ORGANISM="Florenciella parvula, Strain CCMP2471" /LENGTH=339 /DNA_ID=CAMNT_0007521871 /DNA_START=135 /DNA_END=1154 /DNA_ORIENTATION=+